MTERESFIKAICANRDDDTVRMVFADWLEENGEPERAEFIRVQIELSTHPFGKMETHALEHGSVEPHDASDPKQVEAARHCNQQMQDALNLKRRERELLKWKWFGHGLSVHPFTGYESDEYLVEWVVRTPSHRELTPPCATFTRGFVSSVTCTAADWIKHGSVICEQQPVERVKLTTRPENDEGWGLDWVTTLREGNIWHVAKFPNVIFEVPDRIARVRLADQSVPIELRVSADVRLWDRIASDAQGRGIPISPDRAGAQLILGTVIGFNDNP